MNRTIFATGRGRLIGVTAGLIGAALMSLAVVPSSAAADTPPITNPSAAAAGWLVNHFQDADCNTSASGDRNAIPYEGTCYGASVGGTIDGVIGLAAAKAGGTKLAQLKTYLDGAVDAYAASGAGGAGKGLLAYEVLGDTSKQASLVTVVNSSICTAAGTGCTAAGAGKNIFSSVSQSLIVLGLGRAGSTSKLNDTIDFLLSGTECATGGFTSTLSNTPTCSGDIDASAYALMALTAAESHVTGSARLLAVSKAIDDTISFLLDSQLADGSWDDNVDSTGLAVAALTDHPTTVSQAAATSEEATDIGQAWLAGQQLGCAQPADQVGSVPFDGAYDLGTTFKATTDALLGLTQSSLTVLTAAGIAAAAPVQDCTVPIPTPTPTVTPTPSVTSEAPAVVATPTTAAAALAATGTHGDGALGILGGALLLAGAGAVLASRRGGART